jgi:hypothetical protein
MSNFDQMPRASNESPLRYPERDTLGVPPKGTVAPHGLPGPMGLRSGRLNPPRLAAARIALAWGETAMIARRGVSGGRSGWELVSTTTHSDDGGRKLSLKKIGVLRVAERDI